jgi:sulfur carrier protein
MGADHLRRLVPMLAVTVNGASHTLRAGETTVAELLRELALDGKRIAVEQNGSIVPRGLHAATAVRAGDTIEIVAAVGGG